MRVDGVPVRDIIRIRPYVPMVGHYKRSEPVVLVDRKITDPREQRSLAMHEAGERYLRFGEGLGPVQAHQVAEREETHWAARHGVNVPRYTRNVEHVFRENRREGVRRRR
jgi:hypothetical protein